MCEGAVLAGLTLGLSTEAGDKHKDNMLDMCLKFYIKTKILLFFRSTPTLVKCSNIKVCTLLRLLWSHDTITMTHRFENDQIIDINNRNA